MAALSYQTLESLWTSAGGPPELAPTMAAIAIAESGGDPSAMNTTPPDYSVGLWQINYYGDMLPGRTKAYGSPSALRASPQAQARAAVSIYKSQGLKAWSTYTNGAYKKYMNGAAYNGSDAAPGGGTSGTGTVTQASDTSKADCLVGFDLPVVGYVCLLTKGQGRAVLGSLLCVGGAVVGGLGLIILAAYGLQKSGALDQAASAANVVPGAGKLAGQLAAGAQHIRSQPKTTKQRAKA